VNNISHVAYYNDIIIITIIIIYLFLRVNVHILKRCTITTEK